MKALHPGFALTLTLIETAEDRSQALQLLQHNQLPVHDLAANTQLYLLREDARIIGTGGLEIYGEHALLRSISVAAGRQGEGLGRVIVEQLEGKARAAGLHSLTLLTTTAPKFFAHLGYETIARDEAPAAVRESAEFKSTCPASAVVMVKRLC